MNRLFYTLFCMTVIMLFAGESMAQQLVGESEPFIFDTRTISEVPLSNTTVLIVFFMLAGSLILLRYYLQKRKSSV
jgi:hypothetical protein